MPVIPEPHIRASYRGLNSFEEQMLQTFLRQQDLDTQRLETQLRLGPGEQLPESQPESFRKQWQQSSKLKLDALVDTGSRILLLEIKDFIRTSHLGQLLSYRYWFDVEHSPESPVELWAVAEDINPSSVQPGRFHNLNFHLTTPEGTAHFTQGLNAQPPFAFD